jgi:hypothetical protein
MESFETVEDLDEECGGFAFRESFFVLEVVFEVSAIAELGDDKYILGGPEGINKPDHIIVSALFEDFDLGLDQLLEFRSLSHFTLRDYLHRNRIMLVIGDGLENNGPCTRPQHPQDCVVFHAGANHLVLFLHTFPSLNYWII